jgi:hypothetical protein
MPLFLLRLTEFISSSIRINMGWSSGRNPRSGPSPAHFLLLAAIHRICQPGPRTEVAGWYDRTILRSLWDFSPERFTSQEFWDCFDRIPEEELEQAQIRLLGLWKQKQLVSRRLLAYGIELFCFLGLAID